MIKYILLPFLVFLFVLTNVQAQQSRPVSELYESHAREHLVAEGFSGRELDSLVHLSLSRKISRANEKPTYHPFGDDRDVHSAISDLNCEGDNWGFENGDFSGWTTNGSVYLVNGGIDPYGSFPWVYPSGGSYSVRLMSDNSYGDFAGVSRQITVPANGSTYLPFHFAISILSMDHFSMEAARFQVRVYDSSGAEVPCPSLTSFYSADLGPQGMDNVQQTEDLAYAYNPGASEGFYPVTYSDWSDVVLDLTAFAGQTLTVEFSASYCIYDPHWCYALLDVDCPINNVSPQVQCSSPPLYPICAIDEFSSYTWTNESGEVIGSEQCIDALAPGTYYCVCSNQDECTGANSVQFQYVISPNPEVLTTFIPSGCVGDDIIFNNNSTLAVGIIDEYIWDFGDGIQSNSANPLHSYNNAGDYEISVIAISDVGCKDTAFYQLSISNGNPCSPVSSTCSSLPSNLQQGLVGYWPFCGNANDESGNGNDGVVNGATLTEDRFGNEGKAYGFDGNSDFINCGSSTQLESSELTISAWYACSAFNTQWNENCLLSNYTNQGFMLALNEGTQPQIRITTNEGNREITASTPSLNEWYHLVSVITPQYLKLYVNNNLVDSIEMGSAIFTNNDTLVMGKASWFENTAYYSGSLDDIGIWNRALTPEEVQELYTLDACTFTVYDTLTVYETVYDTVYTYETIYDTVTTYVTVTDTLLIDITFTGFEGQPSWLNTVTVFPNPASDHITIDYGNFALMAGYNTIITDAAGATVYSSAVNSQQVEIDINAWGAAGVYYMMIYDLNGELVAVRQIVLE